MLQTAAAYAMMPLGKKEMRSSSRQKNESPNRVTAQSGDSSFLFTTAKHPPDYLLPLSPLSSHLQMRWQTTPDPGITRKPSCPTPNGCFHFLNFLHTCRRILHNIADNLRANIHQPGHGLLHCDRFLMFAPASMEKSIALLRDKSHVFFVNGNLIFPCSKLHNPHALENICQLRISSHIRCHQHLLPNRRLDPLPFLLVIWK